VPPGWWSQSRPRLNNLLENETTTDVRLGGRAILSIHYGNYKVVAQSKAPESRISEQEKKHPALIGDYEQVLEEITLK